MVIEFGFQYFMNIKIAIAIYNVYMYIYIYHDLENRIDGYQINFGLEHMILEMMIA